MFHGDIWVSTVMTECVDDRIGAHFSSSSSSSLIPHEIMFRPVRRDYVVKTHVSFLPVSFSGLVFSFASFFS